jgi:hypothetical protein
MAAQLQGANRDGSAVGMCVLSRFLCVFFSFVVSLHKGWGDRQSRGEAGGPASLRF